jgi:hypothetical protein
VVPPLLLVFSVLRSTRRTNPVSYSISTRSSKPSATILSQVQQSLIALLLEAQPQLLQHPPLQPQHLLHHLSRLQQRGVLMPRAPEALRHPLQLFHQIVDMVLFRQHQKPQLHQKPRRSTRLRAASTPVKFKTRGQAWTIRKEKASYF